MSAVPPPTVAPPQPVARRLSPPQPTGWRRWLPGLTLLRPFPPPAWRHDLAAGLVLSAMLVPVGIAYATASGLPGIHGLYATVAALLAYALFGPSRILVLGPDSALAALILAVVLPLSGGDGARAVALAGLMALVCAVVCIVAGLARLGFITQLLSKPIRHGYMNGIALAILISQLPVLFGLQGAGDGPWRSLVELARALLAGQANGASFGLGAAALGLIVLLKRWPRWPAMLIAIAVATALAALFGLDEKAGVAVLGALPQGLPALAVPWVTQEDLLPVLGAGLAAALVAFADTSVLSRGYAQRAGTAVDANQEMIALGAANLACGLFQGFPISSSASRTPVAEAAGARTQLTGVVGALAVMALLLTAPALLRHLPYSALAAVVIVSAIGLIEWRDLRRIHRIQPWEFWLSMACMAGVLGLGALQGIALAVAIAVIEFVWDAWRPYSAVLGRTDAVDGFHDIQRHPEARQIPGLLLLRWAAPLFFANAEAFQERVLQAVDAAATPVRWLVVTAEPVTSIDVTAADMLAELDRSLHAAGIELCFAEMKGPVKDKLKRFGLFGQFGEHTFFATIDAAVRQYLVVHPQQAARWDD